MFVSAAVAFTSRLATPTLFVLRVVVMPLSAFAEMLVPATTIFSMLCRPVRLDRPSPEMIRVSLPAPPLIVPVIEPAAAAEVSIVSFRSRPMIVPTLAPAATVYLRATFSVELRVSITEPEPITTSAFACRPLTSTAFTFTPSRFTFVALAGRSTLIAALAS